MVVLVLLSLGFVLAYILARYMPISKRKEPKDHYYSLPGGSMGWPFIGETAAFFKPHRSDSIGRFLQQHCSRYGKVFKSHICGGPAIVSCDHELNAFVLQNEEKLFQAAYPKVMHDILGTYSLFFVSGDLHKKLRNVITSFIALNRSNPDFLLCIDQLSISLLDSWRGRTQVRFHDEIKVFTLGIMVKQLLSIGPEEPTAREVLQDFVTYMRGFVSLPIPIPGTAYSKAVKARKRLSKRVAEMMEGREKREEGGRREGSADFLDVIMSREDLNHEMKVSLVLDILLGGYETSATLLSLILYFLARAPPTLLHKLKEEHEAIRAKKGAGEPLNMEDYQEMEFTRNVIHEALRCGNIVKLVHRKAIRDVKFKEYVIPSGWLVFPVFTAANLDQSLHDNPCEFNPMRWTEKGMGKKLTPFGGGSRLCPGAEIAKLENCFFIHHLVLSYRWRIKEDEMPIAHPFVEFKRGMLIEIEPMEDNNHH
ncbi:PREDICTED: cytochrome P450 724B1 isoform X2 [Tarenaya hassleriana]|uniref:cytochrome P450 724B1 isoform X2 n=1 Tax=Tarenaya hassleriana TaxID=28532 RepID=UPI00053C3E95|nr:PREDICTED: cytochrome P450 724B1 isoform X2 [Tarenaya hassleriana]